MILLVKVTTIYLNKLTNSSAHQQTRIIVCSKNDNTTVLGFYTLSN